MPERPAGLNEVSPIWLAISAVAQLSMRGEGAENPLCVVTTTSDLRSIVESVGGLGLSAWWDLPTGAAVVSAFGLAMVLAAIARYLRDHLGGCKTSSP